MAIDGDTAVIGSPITRGATRGDAYVYVAPDGDTDVVGASTDDPDEVA